MDIIIAIDDFLPSIIVKILEETHGIDEVIGYKIGAAPALYNSLAWVVGTVSKYDPNKKIIFDHQKAGNDLGAMATPILHSIASSGIREVIIFPFTGEQIALEWLDAAKKFALTPIFGGYLTDPNFDTMVDTDRLFRMFDQVRMTGVTDFVLPATRESFTSNILHYFSYFDIDPAYPHTYYMPGIGAQGASLDFVKELDYEYNVIPIVGRSITQDENIRAAACELLDALNK